MILTLPNFLAMQVEPLKSQSNGTNLTLYVLQWSKLGLAHDRLLYKLNVWFYGFFLKLLPCILLIIITCLLIRALYQFSSSNRCTSTYATSTIHLRLETSIGGAVLSSSRTGRTSSRKRKTDRTTRLLIVILLLFVLTELPQGIITMVAAVLGTDFFEHCYTPLGEVMDLLALTNCTVNFVLYCLMSRQFRITFRKTFHLGQATCQGTREQQCSPTEIPPKPEYTMVPLNQYSNEHIIQRERSFNSAQQCSEVIKPGL